MVYRRLFHISSGPSQYLTPVGLKTFRRPPLRESGRGSISHPSGLKTFRTPLRESGGEGGCVSGTCVRRCVK